VAVVLRMTFLVVLVALGVALGVIGVLGWRERLARSGRFGVRTPAALRSDAAFRLANRVAGPPVLVAGIVATLGGVAAFGLPTPVPSTVVALIALVGAVLIARAGGIAGDRAAVILPATTAAPAGCAGCACGGCG
jgi:uncharacterized membrane protein